MSTFADLARKTARFAVNNSPTILTTVGVVGAITTAYLAGKASFEAADIIRLKEADDERRGTVPDTHNELMKQRFQLVWKLYIPAMTMGTASVVCILGANRIGSRRAAGLAAAYTISEKAFEQYKEKVVEKIGERKEQQVRDEVMQDRLNEVYDPSMEIYGDAAGELCMDKYSLMVFRSTAQKIEKAAIELNHMILRYEGATLSEFYDLLGLPQPGFSEQIGWSVNDGPVEIHIGGALTPDGKPCLCVEFLKEPIPDFRRFR